MKGLGNFRKQAVKKENSNVLGINVAFFVCNYFLFYFLFITYLTVPNTIASTQMGLIKGVLFSLFP